MNAKFYIGPMSKNIVDCIIDFSNLTKEKIGFIPSRRQIDYNGGYVNNWTTSTFSSYIKSFSTKIILQRDHGGPNQGSNKDDGIESFKVDCQYLDLIHIDPWKTCQTFELGCELTAKYIRICYSINPNIKYEIGTEQSIFQYSNIQLDYFISYLKKELREEEYKNIVFAVIQCGTSLKENINTGIYNENKLKEMVSVCKTYGLLTKEHNGDYLPIDLIYKKFKCGLDSINVAPEFGQIETKTYLNELKESNLFDTYFDICYNSKKWVKWTTPDFNPFENKETLISICGHYVLSDPIFLKKIKCNVRKDIDTVIKNNIREALKKLYGYT